MRKWIYDCWNHVMDAEVNPLRNIPDLQQGIYFNKRLYFSVGGIGNFGSQPFKEISKRFYSRIDPQNPLPALIRKGYHSYGRGRQYTIYRDKNGNAHKVPLPAGDPGGEHE